MPKALDPQAGRATLDHVSGHEHLAGIRQCAEPGRFRLDDAKEVTAGGDHPSPGNAATDLQREVWLVGVPPREIAGERPGAVDRVARIVEGGVDTVAGVLYLEPPELLEPRPDEAIVHAQLFRVEGVPEPDVGRGRAHDVVGEDRPLLASAVRSRCCRETQLASYFLAAGNPPVH